MAYSLSRKQSQMTGTPGYAMTGSGSAASTFSHPIYSQLLA